MSKRNFFSEQKKRKGSGSRVHAPRLQDRVSTHKRITDGGAEGIVKIGVDDIGPTTTYCLPLSDTAFSEVSDFAFRALLEKQYERWEDAIQAGAERSSIGDEDIITSHGFQEIYQALNALMECTTVAIGGLKVIYDTAISEIITVAAAHARGYTDTFESGAADSDIFLVIHVLPDKALLDATYGNDISHSDSYSGSLKVFGGKVVRDVPKPFFSMTYAGNPVGDLASDEITDSAGNYFHTFIPIPQISGGTPPPGYTYIDVPPNCCNGGAQPPNVPPTTPPTVPGTLPTPPTPVGITTADIACSEIFSQSGESFDFWSDLASFGARVYGNRPSNSTQYPVALGGAIHTWIHDNVPDFDFRCDKLLSVTMLLHMTHTDPRIFGVITNPFGSNNVTPRIDNYKSLGGSVFKHDPVYYFQPDGTTQSYIGVADIVVNRYTKFIYETSHKITVRDEDRYEGHIGTEDWFYYVDESDVIDAASVDPMSLQVCGIQYKKHQYVESWNLDGTDEVRTISGVKYLYGKYGNARIAFNPINLSSSGLLIGGDGLHPSGFDIDWICDLSIAGTDGVVTGTVTQTPFSGDTDDDYLVVHVDGVADPTTSSHFVVPLDSADLTFSVDLVTVFPANIGTYVFHVHNGGVSQSLLYKGVTAYIS